MTRLRFATRGPLADLSEAERQAILERGTVVTPTVRDRVREIQAQVQATGDKALLELTERFDGVTLDTLRVPDDALATAHAEADEAFLSAFRAAVDQIHAYHASVAAAQEAGYTGHGVQATERQVPLGRVGIYVPGGRAAYPSTVAMTVVPARAAGVEEIILATPPGANGQPHPLVMAACHELGVDHVVPVGGAQAILALADGTEQVPACQAVVGPGNAYVQAAKELVAGQVRIDAPAGPSEVAVLMDDTTDPRVAALEVAAQAEHDPASVPIALCLDGTDQALIDALDALLEELPRADIIADALSQQGAILSVESLDEAQGFLDDLAPEHCVLLNEAADELATTLTGPACIVHGPRARVPITDYVAGPSHVLPTGGAARAYSGISVDTFTKHVHVVDLGDVDEELLAAGARLARLEGLDAHARAIEEEPR